MASVWSLLLIWGIFLQESYAKCIISKYSLPQWQINAKMAIHRDEGEVRTIYFDSEGYATVGIGHLILPTDTEFHKKVPYKDRFTCALILRYFHKDFTTAVNDAKSIINNKTSTRGGFDGLPDTVKEILVNMAFQLGQPRLSKFKKMLVAISKKDYRTAAYEMMNSRWYGQSGNRSHRLVQRMRTVN